MYAYIHGADPCLELVEKGCQPSQCPIRVMFLGSTYVLLILWLKHVCKTCMVATTSQAKVSSRGIGTTLWQKDN